MKALFDQVSRRCSVLATKSYSTSFSLGIRFIHRDFRAPIYAIYGFVRFADEIVDTFHEYNREILLDRFEEETYRAIDEKISLNPILNSFQECVNKYRIDRELITTFLRSMRMDLHPVNYTPESYNTYILGSAEVVGLMCLKVWVNGDEATYERLKPNAMRLGAAFQKINFLRDLNADYEKLGRTYFPGVNLAHFGEADKQRIEEEIAADFAAGFEGIKQLPRNARFGVYVAYVFYYNLFKKIKRKPSQIILQERVRISNPFKYAIFLKTYLRHSFNIL